LPFNNIKQISKTMKEERWCTNKTKQNNYVCYAWSMAMLVACLFLGACSTEKNTAVNRSFHYVNARFNGHFNANELIDIALTTYRNNVEEDYYTILPLEAIPNATEIEAYYPMIDTAISKVKTVITDHSMPSHDRPAYKNAEHNNYIDENWITIGRAYYYRRDYETALRNFKFVNKYFSNDPSNYIGELWMAKTNLRIGNYTNARLHLDHLDQVIKNQEENAQSQAKNTKSKKGKKKSKAKDYASKGDAPAKFPNKIKFDFYRTRADLSLVDNDYIKAIEQLELALVEAKKSEDKGRTNYILGQLYEQQGNYGMAVHKYRKARQYKIPFQMSFNAQLKASLLESGDKTIKKLHKMIRDAKNAEYRDQIYYTLALIDLAHNQNELAVENLSQSVFYSTTNTRQKGMSYEKLGDLSYQKREYIQAQKFYDSCVLIVNEYYPNKQAIQIKAEKLSDLVKAVETANYEDSIQRIAKMSPAEQEKFLKNLIKQQEEADKEKTKREAEKLAELARNNTAFQQDISQRGTSYWANSTLIMEGTTEFLKIWGERTNEDHWRRSQKTPGLTTSSESGDSQENSQNEQSDLADTETEKREDWELMLDKLPKTEEDFMLSNQRIAQARYQAGVIYKEMLSETDLAKTQFLDVLARDFESDYKVMSAYQLYKIAEQNDRKQAIVHKNYILNNYPNSDYANYLRDPDYFIKKRERDQVAEQEYVDVLQRYERKIYYPVILKAQQVIDNEIDNRFRAKYMLLLAMSTGQTSEDKTELIPILERLVEDYPNSDEATRAKEMIDIIKNGYSVNEELFFGNNTIYEYREEGPLIVVIFLTEKENVDLSKTKITDFTREFFPKSKLRVSSSLFGNTNTIRVAEFQTEKEAKDYVRIYKETKKYLLDLRHAKTRIFTPNNLKILYDTNEIDQYELFYQEYY